MQKSFFERLGAPPRASCPEGGFTVVESMIAISVLAIAAFSALTTLNRSTLLDENLRERSIALRAAMTRMESIAAYDYQDHIVNLTNYWSQAANSTFTVDGLRPPAAGSQGTVTINNADPQRIVFTVTVSWRTRNGENRSLSLPQTFTEIIH
jgi:prepilin-type N-terminal cleavage/methylation domain-containing protein